MNLFFRTICVIGFSLAMLCGCSKGTGRLAVKGSVSFKGLPLPHGNIQFFPLEEGKGESAGYLHRRGHRTYLLQAVSKTNAQTFSSKEKADTC